MNIAELQSKTTAELQEIARAAGSQRLQQNAQRLA